MPTEYRADLAVTLLERGKAVLGIALEVQLRKSGRKRFTWPLYAVAGRARLECPFVVAVITPNESIAAWARVPVDLGGGQTWAPCVLGPTEIPRVMDAELAASAPELAVLSAIVHANAPVEVASRIAEAAFRGLVQVPDEPRLLYSALIERSLSATTRKVIEMLPDIEKFLSKRERNVIAKARARAKAEGRAEGKAEGKIETVLRILDHREIAVTAAQRKRILACTDLATVERWLDRSLTASKAAELFE